MRASSFFAHHTCALLTFGYKSQGARPPAGKKSTAPPVYAPVIGYIFASGKIHLNSNPENKWFYNPSISTFQHLLKLFLGS